MRRLQLSLHWAASVIGVWLFVGTASAVSAQTLFTRHVEPVFSRLGCNSGGCHSKVRGEAGFQLSLVGISPGRDHQSLVREFAGRRVNLATPEQSLILLKVTGVLPHGGGQRTDVGSSEYGLLKQWIGEGVALGEMGRTPEVGKGKPYGREHSATSQFVLAAGGGFARGNVVGATDARAAYVADKHYKVASLAKTIYHLPGINPDHELYTSDNRPLKFFTENVPVIKEALA